MGAVFSGGSALYLCPTTTTHTSDYVHVYTCLALHSGEYGCGCG